MNDNAIKLGSEEIRMLTQRNQPYVSMVILLEWLTIAGTIYFSEQIKHPIVYAFAILILGSRMYALYSLLHDGLHCLLFKNRMLNDWVCRLFLAWPIFASLPVIRKIHLAHHRFLQTEEDPEFGHIKYAEFQFPKPASTLFWVFAMDLIGLNFLRYKLKHLASIFLTKNEKSTSTHPIHLSVADTFFRWLYYLLIFSVSIYFGLSKSLFLYWIIPYCTIFQALNRLRLSTEHFLMKAQTPYKTRTVRLPLWERWFLSPHNLGYHTEHHLYPGVPFYKLPTLHLQLMHFSEYKKNVLVSRSYFSVIRSYIKQ